MNSKIVLETSRATLAGTTPFPEVVGQLLATGVEYYHVDYAALCQTFYGADGDRVITPLSFEGLPSIAPDWNRELLRAAILDSQQHGQKFRDFSRRAMEAGVAGYFAFLRGKRVTYFGRAGDQHTEWFPGASPDAPFLSHKP